MKIIDGHTGESHVTSVEVAAYNEGITGVGDFVLPVADQFQATQLSNTEIQIGTGLALVGGIRCGNVGETASALIQAGTVGAWRHDLIGIQYDRDPDTLIESCTLTTIQGENGTETSAADPDYDTGDIISGAESRFMPLYRVILDGVNIDSITPLFAVPQNMDDLTHLVSIETYNITSSGTWTWTVEKYSNGTFHAYARNADDGTTGTMNNYGNNAIGITQTAWTIDFPSFGQTEITWADIRTIANAGYALFNPIYNLTLNSLRSTYVRFGSAARATGLSVEIHLRGRWE